MFCYELVFDADFATRAQFLLPAQELCFNNFFLYFGVDYVCDEDIFY